MNTELRRCMLLVSNVVAVVFSVQGTDIPVINVCEGESVEAFRNIGCCTCVYLDQYVSFGNYLRIASWLIRNCAINETVQQRYNTEVSLDKYGTIKIHNVTVYDRTKYVVTCYNNTTLSLIQEVQIDVMAAPTKDCKPIITNTGNVLSVTVNPEYCGHPMVNAYWKCSNTGTDTDRTLLNVDAGTKTCAYHSCIEGPALRCVSSKSHTNYCFPSTPTMQDTITPHSSESHSEGYLVATWVLGACLVMSLFFNVFLCKKGSGNFSLTSILHRMRIWCGKCSRGCANKCTRSGEGQSHRSGQLPVSGAETEPESIPLQDTVNVQN